MSRSYNEEEFKKFMDGQVERMRAHHRAFMWKMAPRLILLILLFVALIWVELRIK